MKTKIFCIGFHKTGTTSLALALEQLGYRVTGAFGVRDPDIDKKALPMAHKLIKKYDAFQDNPWPIIYKELDASYPGSKFILTLRDPDKWIKSQISHFGLKETPMRKWIYGAGSPVGNEDTYLNKFREHNDDVLNYFKHRQQDLLVMNFAEGDGWEKLCPFLGTPQPETDFPHANKADEHVKKPKTSVRLLIKNSINALRGIK